MLLVLHQNISIPEISNYIVAKKAMEHCSEEPKILNESTNGCIRPAQVALTFDLRLIYISQSFLISFPYLKFWLTVYLAID